MPINLLNPSSQNTPVLIADLSNSAGGSPDAVQGLTVSNGQPISTCCEFKSIFPITIPRLTSAQIAAIPNLLNGMIMYNSTTNQFVIYQNNVFQTFQSLLVSTTGTISNAAIKALSTTPFQLVPTPGPGFAIMLNTCTVEHIFNTAPFTGSGQYMFATYNTLYVNGAVISSSTTYDPFGSTANSIMQISGYLEVNGVNTTPLVSALENMPLTLTIQNALTVGSGTGFYTVSYNIVPVV